MYTHLIKQHSTLPRIKFPINNQILKKYDITKEMMEDVAVTFSMVNEEGVYRIANKKADLLIVDTKDLDTLDESQYTLSYKFTLKDTKFSGRFTGEFVLDFLANNEGYCGKIKFPVDNPINITITPTITKTTVV